MKVILSWLLILVVAVFCLFETCFAEEQMEKIDENTAKAIEAEPIK